MNVRARVQLAAAVAALLVLAVLASSVTETPGGGPQALGRAISAALGGDREEGQPVAEGAPWIGASNLALTDIPPDYLGYYVTAAERACPALDWQLLAAIGKIESDHGRSSAPGVRSGVNRAGCCAGPMQFNIKNGPPSTWDYWGTGRLSDVYDPRHAIPAAARKLCGDGLANPDQRVRDPCPAVDGSAVLHRALKRYNNACWYVHEVVVLANRYTLAAPPIRNDPFLAALIANPNLATTRSRGCDPGADLVSGRVDLRVQSLLWVLLERHKIRVSCITTGHSYYVKGTKRVSNHTVWRAVDIDQVDGEPVSPRSAAARRLVLWLDKLEGPLRPAEIGSPFDIGRRPYFSDRGHQGHVHIGYGG